MLAIIVPCYNENESLLSLVEELGGVRVSLDFDVIFVDDGSRDGSADKLDILSTKHDWIKVVRHERNMGLARSLKDGFATALNEGYDFIAQMDCDGTHPARGLIEMMNKLDAADLVIASRYVEGGGMTGVPYWRVALSRAANRFFRLILGIKTLDVTSGYRIGKTEVYRSFRLEEDSFGIQLEMTVKAERAGFKINEVPFVLANRELGSSKFRLRYILTYIPLAFRLIVKR